MAENPVISILVGSIREDSYSLRIAHVLSEMMTATGRTPAVIDPRIVKPGIPHHPDDSGQTSVIAKVLQEQVKKSAGIVFITPEYDGSYSAVSKILIEHLGYPSVLTGKAVMVIGVASGRIGAHRAIEHLRAVLLHIGALVFPGQLSFAEVHKHFSDTGVPDPKVEQQLREKLTDFLAFL